MALRSWLIRGSILAALGLMAAGGYIASSWVSPEAVRAQVLSHLNEQFLGVDVHIESARMRIFGGIAVTDLKFMKAGDSPNKPFFSVPSAVLYHDKEQLNRGRLVIRKIELDNPEVWLERGSDGGWNIFGLMKPSPSDKPIPTVVARGATLHVVDHSPEGLPPITLTHARFTVLNDPLPVLNIEAQAASDGYGPLNVRARLNRVSNQLSVGVDFNDVTIGEALTKSAAHFAPDFAKSLSRLSANATVSADLTYTPDATPPLHHDVRVTVKNGRFEHPDLPWPLEKIEGTARIVDGRVKLEKSSAQAGPVSLELALEMRDNVEPKNDPLEVSLTKSDIREAKFVTPEKPIADGSPQSLLRGLEENLRWLKFTAKGVPLDDAACRRLPGETPQKMRRMFQPTGAVDATYEFTRDAAGWKRETEFRPKGIGLVYEKFKYPVGDVRGTVRRSTNSNGHDSTLLKLHGKAGGQPITIDGQVYGEDDDPAINLRIAGTNVPIDDTFFAALPGKYPTVVRQFHASGRGDFVAEIRQPLGVNLLENTYTIDLRDALVNYAQFPYPLEKVKGRVIVRTTTTDPKRPLRPGEPIKPLPDRDEVVLQEFTGVHAGGTVNLRGSKQPIPNTPDKKLTLHINGTTCPLDADLKNALTAIKLEPIWSSLAPTGAITFSADVEILDRGFKPDSGFASASDIRSTKLPNAPEPKARGRIEQVMVGDTTNLGDRAVLSQLDMKPIDAGTVNAIVAAATTNTDAKEGPPFDPVTDLKLTFNFYGPTVTPSFFPYPVKDLSGWLEYKSGKVDLGQFAGRHGESLLKLAAGDVRFYQDGVIWANIGGLEIKPLVTDAEFLKALPRRLRKPVEEMKLKGAAELNIKHFVVLTPPDRPATEKLPPAQSIPVPVAPPGMFPIPPVGPPPTKVGEKAASATSVFVARGQAADSSVASDPDPVLYWDMEVRLLNASLDVGLPWTDVIGAVAIRGRYEGSHLGQLRGNLWLDQVSIAQQPVTRAKVSFTAPAQAPDPNHRGQFLPPRIEFHDLTGTLFHGGVGGEARVVFDDPVRYEIWLTATEVQLDEVARHYQLGSDADLKGIAQAQVWFANRPDPKTGQPVLVGEGKVDVPTGRMYNLPVLLDLVKVLKLQAPDKTAFEEAHAKFSLQGDRLKVDQLDLIGAAVCLGGSGELDTKGDFVRFEFYTIWSQLLKRWLTTPVGDITAFFSKSLFKIKMIRKDGTLTYEGEVVPIVTEPAKNILERVKRNAGRLTNKQGN